MEFLVGGCAAACAGLFTNPLEVVKTRMQLQGELQARGHYTVHYRNVFQAFFAIGKYDGILALQKGLGPAIVYQFCMNGVRLGSFQWMENHKLLNGADGHLSFGKTLAAGAVSGALGAALSSPAYMIKTHLQAMSETQVAVGYQHHHSGFIGALRHIYASNGIKGLWRGVSGAVSRVMIGSAAQLSTFSNTKLYFRNLNIFPKDSYFIPFCASLCSGAVTVAVMTPFDVVSTRLYNQGIDPKTGKGISYSGILDCWSKIFVNEGVFGFYKGWAASLFRLGPHTVLSLFFWNNLQSFAVQNKVKEVPEIA